MITSADTTTKSKVQGTVTDAILAFKPRKLGNSSNAAAEIKSRRAQSQKAYSARNYKALQSSRVSRTRTDLQVRLRKTDRDDEMRRNESGATVQVREGK